MPCNFIQWELTKCLLHSARYLCMAASIDVNTEMRWTVLTISLAFALLSCFVEAKQKPINVALYGKWSSTPLLLEASEFLAKESNDNFWTFVSRIADENPMSIQTAPDDIKYKIIQKYAAELLSPLQMSFLKFALSLRAYSPSVQMYQQIVDQIEPRPDCYAFIEVNGEFTCESSKMSELLTTAVTRDQSTLYQFDHIYPGSNKKKAIIILYAELGTRGFQEFHQALAELAGRGEITYALRHFVKDTPDKNVRLSGYGVELAIKSTEYKAKDDTKVEGGDGGKADDEEDDREEIEGLVFSKLKEIHPDLKAELKDFRNHLIDSATELTPLKVWQLQDLSFQASQKIVSAPPEDALQYLRDISQNFPTQARSLVRTSVSSDFRKEVKHNQMQFESRGINAGDSLLYLNGLSVDLEVYDVFTLLDLMTSEAKLVEGLHSLGFKGENLQHFLQMDLKEGDDQSYAVDIRHSAIQYLNDLANDKKYRNWPGSVQDLLRPTFPGMLRHIAKNIFNLIFVVNPLEASSKNLLKMAEAFYVHKAPLRIGIAFSASTEPGVTGFTDPAVALIRAFTFISIDQGSPAKGLSFITDVYEKSGGADLTPETVMAEFALQYPGEDKDLVFGDSDDYDDVRKAGADFISRTGLSTVPQVLVNGVPLDESMLGDSFEEGVVTEVLQQTQIIIGAVYKGEVNDRTDLLDWWMERDNVLPRLNSRVLAATSLRVDFTGSATYDSISSPTVAAEMTSRELTSGIANGLHYLTKREEASLRPVTMWVIADLETAQGRDVTYNAIKHLKQSNDVRLGIIFNPVNAKADNSFNKAVHVALETLPMAQAKSFVTKLVKEENAQELLSGTKSLKDLEVHEDDGMDTDKFLSDLNSRNSDFLKIHGLFASKVLSLKPGERAMVTNGGVLGPLAKDEELAVEDINLLERLAFQQAGKKVAEAVKALGEPFSKDSNLVMKVAGLLSSQGKRDKRQKIDYAKDTYSAIKVPADASVPAFTVEAIVDPVSREAQKMAPILMVLKEIANVDVKIYMNPREQLSEMPLKSFYRYVLEPEIQFDQEGALDQGPSAKFLDMPQKSLLTLNMDTPESWLVEAVTSPYDLDNILLEEVDRSVNADFELEYLLLEGHCSDASTMQPPRGLQFVLGTNAEPAQVDTIVMANLGYFQLKANPGLWTLQLREGRSQEIYTINSHENTDSPTNSTNVIVAISNFKSKIIRLKVAKKPDKMDVSLLQDDEVDNGGLWDSISNTISGGSGKGKEEDKDSTLNIFSVASGHLYERFLRIMMLSVLKNTQSKVKFWFLKNYLSPTFKDFIPYMAQEYGFEYELVQYKWPRWLNQQKEKQRIIWGYKILFLDVLFPLDVKKIIFVDADQIVRADLQELADLDLGGAPYGYTPFCDSRKEMDGFRFWNSGYWKSHLAGRKYHISALYVVDLKRFRRIAAGDRLRGQYQGLSQDPNSLANLDQDLPNNMIHQVAIKSLPQEWLYCETWCDTSEKPKAKTIDLCNNPMTKEPKLTAAMRIVPEWKDYDFEIKVLWDEIYQTNTKSQIEYEPPQAFRKPSTKPPKEEL